MKVKILIPVFCGSCLKTKTPSVSPKLRFYFKAPARTHFTILDRQHKETRKFCDTLNIPAKIASNTPA